MTDSRSYRPRRRETGWDAVSDPDPGDEHIGGRTGPEGPVREILVRASTGCHRAESFPAYGFTQNEYQSIVDRMAERGAQTSNATVDQIRLPNLSPGTFPQSKTRPRLMSTRQPPRRSRPARPYPRARLKRWSRTANATQIFVRSGIGASSTVSTALRSRRPRTRSAFSRRQLV